LEDSWRKQDVNASRARAQLLLEADPYRPMTVDVVGLGAGVYDPLAANGFNVQPFNGGEAANDPARFVNRNAESWWAFREGLEAGLIDLDEEDLTLAAQLQSRRWKLDASQRRIRIETKDEMKRRGLPSPDRADAAIMAWYEGVRTVGDVSMLLRRPGDPPSSITGDLLGLKT
jgi:hypothetical protein